MTGRVFIVVIAFLFSACATTPSSTPQFPKVKMEGNRLVDPGYGYSVNIPDGWRMFDKTYIETLPQDTQKVINRELNRLLASGLRVSFIHASQKARLSTTAQGTAYKTKDDLITAWRQSRHDQLKAMNSRHGYEFVFNLEFNTFKNLTDLNCSHESSDGWKYLSYLTAYNFNQSLYLVDLTLAATQSEFDSYLPLFYDCVNSLSVAGVSVTPQDRKSGKTVNERLEELKRLKDKSLITDEEYEKKKKQILNDL